MLHLVYGGATTYLKQLAPNVSSERSKSAWMSTVCVSETPMLAQDNRADVVVVGAGIAGVLPLRPAIATTEHIGSAVKRRRAATARG